MSPSLLLTAETALASGTMLVNPAQAALLRAAGIHSIVDVLALPEEIVSGHPDRQVSRVRLGDTFAYLKKEHRIPWRERLRNLWAGFGLASKSCREATTLRQVERCFSGLPSWIAVGETRDGQAFLLLRELTGTSPLTEALEQLRDNPRARRQLARNLGRALACLHGSGCVHGDLFAPHVLVDTATLQVFFLDWQRTRFSPRECWRDLAALDVTLATSLVGRRDRLACLATYLSRRQLCLSLREAGQAVQRAAFPLAGRRHVRAKALRISDGDRLRLVCLRGDVLRVTPAFLELWPHEVPAFLENEVEEDRELLLPDGGHGRIVRRRHPLSRWHRSGSARRTWTSPQRLQMNLLFRLHRFGITVPEVLAAGETPLPTDQVAAFLLTRLLPDSVGLVSWLAGHADPDLRRCVLFGAGALLARLHDAGCRGSVAAMAVEIVDKKALRVVLAYPDRVSRRRRWGWLGRRWDLWRLRRSLGLRHPAERAALEEGYRAVAESKEEAT